MKESKYKNEYECPVSLSFLMIVVYAIYQIYLLVGKFLMPSLIPDVLRQSFNSIMFCDFVGYAMVALSIILYLLEIFVGFKMYIEFIRMNKIVMLIYYIGVICIIKDVVLCFI